MNAKKIIESLHIYERKVLPALKKSSTLQEIAAATGMDEVEVMRALQWLNNKKLISLKKEEKEFISLDANGEEYIKEGLPEKRFLEAAREKTALNDIREAANLSEEEVNVCLGLLRKKAAINIRKEGGLVIELTPTGKAMSGKESLEEKFLKSKFPIVPNKLNDEEKFAFSELKKRKAIIRLRRQKQAWLSLLRLERKCLQQA